MLLCSVKIVQVPTTNERKETGEMTSDVSNVNLLAAILLIVQHVYLMLVMYVHVTCGEGHTTVF